MPIATSLINKYLAKQEIENQEASVVLELLRIYRANCGDQTDCDERAVAKLVKMSQIKDPLE